MSESNRDMPKEDSDIWLTDVWNAGLVVDCSGIRDSQDNPACFAHMCGIMCRYQYGCEDIGLSDHDLQKRSHKVECKSEGSRFSKRGFCKGSHAIEEQRVVAFRRLHEEKLKHAAALAAERDKLRRSCRDNNSRVELMQPQELPVWVRPLRQELVSSYDAARYNLPELAASVLELDKFGGAVALERLHEDEIYEYQKREMAHVTEQSSPDCDIDPTVTIIHNRKIPLNIKLVHAYMLAGRRIPEAWKKALMREERIFKRLKSSPKWHAFLEAYEKFCQHEILPLCCGTDPDIQKYGMVIQYPPTLRIHMPGKAPSIKMHVDTDYANHQECECNFWVPLTKVFGNNTLWAESEAMKGDFRPFEMEPGQLLRFEGVKCRHYTMANDTAVTRVSFDLRSVPATLWRDLHGGKIGDYGTKLVLPAWVGSRG